MVGHARTGTENYSNQIIRALIAQPFPWAWRLYFNGMALDADLPRPDAVTVRNIPAPRLWTHVRLSREMLANRPSGLFVPSHVIPVVHPPSVVTIHDLGYLHVPEAHPARQRRMLDLTTRWSATVARHIIVPSGQTRDDLIERYRVASSKITVVHHGVDPRFLAALDHPDNTFRVRLNLMAPYVLAVGTLQPRKNLPLLAEAMKSVPADHLLVIAGKRGWMADKVIAGLDHAGLGHRLRLLDYVPDEDLPSLYQNAAVMVQPSRFEGFGMPVLESMASGTPVISARGSSLAEIGGDAALYFDQGDVDELSAQIQAIISDNELHRSIQARGIERARSFTWEQAARKTRLVLQEAFIDER
jgi:glycosyltransferase involved in cell wall biosynthesis